MYMRRAPWAWLLAAGCEQGNKFLLIHSAVYLSALFGAKGQEAEVRGLTGQMAVGGCGWQYP
jgi:hypothetical protein